MANRVITTQQESPPSTLNLYLVDEVLSALQKAIRRSLVEEALFWTLELVRSGLGALAMVRFGVMCSEDLSLGSPCLPQFVLAARRRFKSSQEKEAREVLLQCAHVLAISNKNREPATAAVWVSWRLDEELKSAEGDAARARHWLTMPAPKRTDQLRASVSASIEAPCPAEQLRHEQDALLILQSLFLDDKQELIWRLLLSLQPAIARSPCAPVLRQSVQSLYDMVKERVTTAERYALIHALLLHTRQAIIPSHLWSLPSLPSTPSFDQLAAQWPSRAFAIPTYALDKHTRRGGTGGQPTQANTLQGEDTRSLLIDSARWWGKDASSWSDDEIARSHGPGIVRALHTGRGAGGVRPQHTQSLLSNFYEEGVLCSDELAVLASGDPYRQGAQAFNLALEERFRGKIPDGYVKENLKMRLQRLRTSFFDGMAAGSEPAVDGAYRAARSACPTECGAQATADSGRNVGISFPQPPARGRRRGRLQQAYM